MLSFYVNVILVEEEEDDVEEEEEITASTNEPAIMRAWPPMSDGKNHPKAKSTVDRDEQAESKVWPPPRAPDYMKTVKDLPSGVRVVRESQEGDQSTSQNTTDKLPVADIIKSGEEEPPSEDSDQNRLKKLLMRKVCSSKNQSVMVYPSVANMMIGLPSLTSMIGLLI
ncbi:Hypothetical predicted protein [Mytilus galloprovincialis]|uniref:Uncharacterized protein n=1 Tax=Mytilus galloprovincialis TaxID=29158 RepID=A0A8B6GAT6_MYTGA|nr:Hypothetical predicted protein [Mytilus galloprovincialis]